MNKRQRAVSQAAANAQAEEERARGNYGGGDSAMTAYMRRMGASRSAPRNTAEAMGRAAQTFLLPLIIQGVSDWKTNYDTRGDFKANGARYLDMMLRGEKLNPYQQELLDTYQRGYTKEYDAAVEAARQRLANQQNPNPQNPSGTVPTDGTNQAATGTSPVMAGLLSAINVPKQQQPIMADAPFGAWSTDGLTAPDLQSSILNKFKQDELDQLLGGNRFGFGRW